MNTNYEEIMYGENLIIHYKDTDTYVGFAFANNDPDDDMCSSDAYNNIEAAKRWIDSVVGKN